MTQRYTPDREGFLMKCIDGEAVLYSDFIEVLRRAEEAERRVRWLETELKNREYDVILDRDEGYEGVYSCSACDVLELSKHLPECRLFLDNGTPKPTPEDFK